MDSSILKSDPVTGHIPCSDSEHTEIHEGHHFTATYMKTINAGSVSSIMITTPTAGTGIKTHFVCGVEADKAVTWYLYEGTLASGGSAITAINNDRNSSVTDPNTVVANPVLTTAGTVLEPHRFGATSLGQTSTGGHVVARNEYILATGTSYMVYVIADSATTITVITAPYYYKEG